MIGAASTLALVLSLLLQSGGGKMPAHCADQCEIYAQHLAGVIEDAAHAHDVSPTLLLAVAWHESELDPTAIGALGEVGVWQFIPRSKWGSTITFMCRVHPENCLLYQADIGAWLLAANKEQCGSTRRALSAYNSGRCNGSLAYAERVMATWGRLSDG